MPSLRPFVLLHHTLPDGEHWDLCIDQDDLLATWQLSRDAAAMMASDEAHPVPARRIQDHRKAYLEYEGPVSGNRGSVARIDRGSCAVLRQQPDHWTVRFDGCVMIGSFEIIAAGDSAAAGWTIYRTKPM